jgi:FlaA1/EpsC-like NDP-sugar epimerase
MSIEIVSFAFSTFLPDEEAQKMPASWKKQCLKSSLPHAPSNWPLQLPTLVPPKLSILKFVTPTRYAASGAGGIDWYAFLARPRLPSPAAESLEQLRDASILVTGAGGSIGSALAMQLATMRPRRLVLLDASEHALHRLQSRLAAEALSLQPHIVLANITNHAHLNEIFEIHQPQRVFHAAAYKHVPLLEEHPLEAIANNALGTRNLVNCANHSGVERVVLLSTDKAVSPVSILGATKRIAELITLAAHGVALRLGNVLGSEGSVSETFLNQILSGSPITITSPSAERYFLTCEEAADLLLASAILAPSSSLLAPHLDHQHNILSLAHFLKSTCSPATTPQTIFTGLRPGDKIRESLWSSDELPAPMNEYGSLDVQQHLPNDSLLHRELAQLDDAVQKRDVAHALDVVIRLVPGYQPSSTITALATRSQPGVMHR